MNVKNFIPAGLYIIMMIYRGAIKESSPWIIRVFLDVMPNLLAGISFPFIFVFFLKKLNIKTKYSYFFSCFFGLSWLVIEEFNPVFGHSVVFDWNDIYASFLGTLISYGLLKINFHKTP